MVVSNSNAEAVTVAVVGEREKQCEGELKGGMHTVASRWIRGAKASTSSRKRRKCDSRRKNRGCTIPHRAS